MRNEKAFYEIMETIKTGRVDDEDAVHPCYARVFPAQMGYSAVGLFITGWGKDEDDAELELIDRLECKLDDFAEEYGR